MQGEALGKGRSGLAVFDDRAPWTGVQNKPLRNPLRVRAIIIVDFESRDPEELEQAKAQIIAQLEHLRATHPGAQLEFRQRKPRQRPRAAKPARVIAPYLDD